MPESAGRTGGRLVLRMELADEQLVTAGGAVAITTAPTCTAYTFLGWSACCPAPTTAPNCTVYTFSSSLGCCPSTTD